MPTLFVPTALRRLTEGRETLTLDGATVSAVFAAAEQRYPGFCDAILSGERLRPGLAVTVNGAVVTLGLRQAVPADAEVHILPAIGGG